MKTGLFHIRETPFSVGDFLEKVCDDSLEELEKPGKGTRVWKGVVDGKRYFLKSGPPESLMADREICRVNLHRAIPKLYQAIETRDGILLVFEFVDGTELGYAERVRFFQLPLERKLAALSVIFSAKLAIVERGWILVDFYEGNVIYNFATGDVWVCDFEFYERGNSYILQTDMTYGSSRLRPPEEYCKGAQIDQRANVFTLGRYAICALSAKIDAHWRTGLQGSAELAAVLERATRHDRNERYDTVRDFVEAFTQIASSK